jgi:hypothetical protein
VSETEVEKAEKKRCFVISPIGAVGSSERKAADQALKHLIRKALADAYVIERADESVNPGSITPTMIASILEADLVVADLTGFNPNVFYELAMAHGYSKPTVHIQHTGERPPFDVKDMRIITYDMDPDTLEGAQKALREFAKYVVENPGKAETPITVAQKFTAIQGSTDPVAESNVLVLDAINKLSKEVRSVLRLRHRPASALTSNHLTVESDLASAQAIVERVVADDRAEAADFDTAITPTTTSQYDEWAKGQLIEVLGTDDEDETRRIYHPDMEESLQPNEDEYGRPDHGYESIL